MHSCSLPPAHGIKDVCCRIIALAFVSKMDICEGPSKQINID